MSISYKVKFYHSSDRFGECYHEIVDDMENEEEVEVSFGAGDLSECPEDATLNRCLFNGWDYIEAIELGMKLHELGYNSLDVEHIKENEDED